MTQLRWKLVDINLGTQKDTAGEFWEFRLTLHRTISQDEQEIQEVRAWVERQKGEVGLDSYLIWRSVEERRSGSAQSGPTVKNKVFDALTLDVEVHLRLRELLYLWAHDIEVEERLQPFLQSNLQALREKRILKRRGGDFFFASAVVHLYHVVDDVESGVGKEGSLYMGRASSRNELRQIVLELPSDAFSFEIHFEVHRRIVGNAEYRVVHGIDPSTGKRQFLGVDYEFGACEGLHHFFKDLYDTDEEFALNGGL